MTTASSVTRAVRRHLPAGRRAARGFTLLEVMLALAILGLALTVLIKSAASSIVSAQEAHMMGIVTDLARAKMYDLEEKLLKDGFSDTEQHEDDQPFADEGWPLVHYSYKIEEVELPNWEALQKLAQCQSAKNGSGAGSSSGSSKGSGGSGGSSAGPAGGSDAGSDESCFENSALGGMLTQFGGFGGGGGSGKGSADIGSSIGASFVQGQYTMFQQILKVSIRKITLTVNWQVMGSQRDMKVVQFLTDAAAMDKVINGLGSSDLDDANAAKGSGSGSGSGKSGTTAGSGRGSSSPSPPSSGGKTN